MQLNIRQTDERILKIGLGFRRKILEKIVKDSQRCDVGEMLPQATALACTLEAEKTVEAWGKRDIGFNGIAEVAEAQRPAMWNGVYLYLEKCGKVADEQEQLGVDTADTHARIRLAQNLSDRLHGKLSLFDDEAVNAGHRRLFGEGEGGLESVTVSDSKGNRATMTGAEFDRVTQATARSMKVEK